MEVLDEDCSAGLVVWVVVEGFTGSGWCASWRMDVIGVWYWDVREELGWIGWKDGEVDWVVGESVGWGGWDSMHRGWYGVCVDGDVWVDVMRVVVQAHWGYELAVLAALVGWGCWDWSVYC